MRKLTELEKTILLTVLASVRGRNNYIRKDFIVQKFSLRQRKMVRKYFDKLEKDELLAKNPTGKSYKLTEIGLKRAMKVLTEGAAILR